MYIISRARTGIQYLVLLFVLCMFFSSVYGQEMPKGCNSCKCPNTSIWTKSFEAHEGETLVFQVVFENPNDEKCDVTFEWLVSLGKIIDGQGTRQMRLRVPKQSVGKSILVVAHLHQGEVSCENHPAEEIRIVPK